MNNYDYIIKLLNFQDKNILISKVDFIDNIYYIFLNQLKQNDLYCPSCGSISFTTNFTYTRTILFNPINGFPSFIKFNQFGFKCNYCKKTFNQYNDIVKKGCNISNQTKELLFKEFKKKQSFKDISIRLNLSQTTVSNEFKKQIHDFRCSLSRMICIDEFKTSTISCKYALIISNPENGQILDILPSRFQDYIYHYFNTVDKSERLNVEFVFTDLFE